MLVIPSKPLEAATTLVIPAQAGIQYIQQSRSDTLV